MEGDKLIYIFYFHYKFTIIEEDIITYILKLDKVGPIDYRPSADYIHHFLQKKNTCCM